MTTPADDRRPAEGGHGDEPAAPTGPDGPEGPVLDGELLSEVESGYVTRWLAHERAQRAAGRPGPGAEVVTRRGGVLVRRRVVLARGWLAGAPGVVWRSGPVAHARSLLGYRLRKAPVDVLRWVWFALRGHGRWMGKGWVFLTYGDLRADGRENEPGGRVPVRLNRGPELP